MSSFSRFFLPLIALLFAPLAVEALTVHALYSSACQREVGVILKVDPSYVHLLNTKGKVVKIRPFEVIYLTTYPAEFLPIYEVSDLSSIPAVEIKTRVGGDVVSFVEGWPLGYTKDEISFLTRRGTETVISRRSIFSIDFRPVTEPVRFDQERKRQAYEFEHPFAFRDCPSDIKGEDKVRVFPQQMINQPVTIKRELDVLRTGYERLRWYEREQDFYPVPETVRSETSLGFIFNLGSRYGASTSRTNNYTPVLTDKYSSDIFDYQHTFVTGSAPMFYAAHEEAQTQSFYAFKASYFHLSAMADLNLLLVGSQYPWREADFDNRADLRLNDVTFIEFGFDFGRWAFQLHLTDVLQLGSFFDGITQIDTVNVPKVGLSYQGNTFKVEAFGGSAAVGTDRSKLTNKFGTLNVSLQRANLHYAGWDDLQLTYSLIRRQVNYDRDFTVASSSLTNAVYFTKPFRKRYQIQGMFSAEGITNDFRSPTNAARDDKLYPKAGLGFGLFF